MKKPIIRLIFAITLLLSASLLLTGCGESPERHLDLGTWYYQKGLVDDAILEYKEAIRLSPLDPRRMSSKELELVAQAHHNLAVAYAKKNWYELAAVEAKKAFELRPTTDNYHLQDLILQRKSLDELAPSGS